MRLTKDALEKVSNAKFEWLKAHGQRRGHGVRLDESMFRTGVYINEHYICDFEELWDVASELNLMVEIVKDTLGIYKDE